MTIIKSAVISVGITLFLTACNTADRDVGLAPPAGPGTEAELSWAKDEFDLQRVGPLLERSHDPQEFERYLNDDDGINNLDLNGDGYADYISVEEYYDRGSNARGLSLYDSFGPNLIQEIATIIFYRDDPSWPGARVLVSGNDMIYGDNVYYETNWYDRPVDLISYVFTDHDPYRSPYYYDYYPPDYVIYDVVDTPVYVTRVQQLYPQPVLIYTQQPDIVTKVKIKSPNRDKHFDQVFAKLVKPTKEQQKFIAENHAKPEHQKGSKPGKMPGKIEGPPEQEKTRKEDIAPGQPKVHVEKAPPAAAEPRSPKKAEVKPPKANNPRAHNPDPHGGKEMSPAGKQPKPAPPAAKGGPPAQHGGGKKKG